MKPINGLNYPEGFAELDELVPLNMFLNEHQSFQMCHAEIGPTGAFFLLMRILESEKNSDNPKITTILKSEFMIINAGWSTDKYALDFSGGDPIISIENEKDNEYHQKILNNFRINIVKKAETMEVFNDAEFLQKNVFTYSEPIVFDITNEVLHFKTFENGIERSPNGDKMNLADKSCQVSGGIGG